MHAVNIFNKGSTKAIKVIEENITIASLISNPFTARLCAFFTNIKTIAIGTAKAVNNKELFLIFKNSTFNNSIS
ncbi:hypothetical protein D3C76_1741000 [compost metagenome]